MTRFSTYSLNFCLHCFSLDFWKAVIIKNQFYDSFEMAKYISPLHVAYVINEYVLNSGK